MGMNIKGFAFVTKCARFSRVRNSRTVMYIDILILNKIPQPVSQTLKLAHSLTDQLTALMSSTVHSD